MNNKKIESHEELNKPELERVDNEGNSSRDESEIVIDGTPFMLFTIVFGLIGLILFGQVFYTIHANEKAYAKQEKKELVYEKKRDFLVGKFEGNKKNYLSKFGYVYDFKQHLTYLDEKTMDDYTKKIKSSGWNGEMPASTNIHIKENWDNSTEQKKDLIQLIKELKEHNVVSTQIIYNSTNRLEDIPSKWFVFTTKDYSNDDSFAFLEDLNSTTDLSKLNTIKSGIAVETFTFSNGTSGKSEGKYEYTRFDGKKVE
ncbi:hypothetical protein [Rossellomorea marisflavi]|uniref:hypothetical protein n=1 Tax=Rossellomorea marisflavi TaxID=189381 RepID=UPI003F9F5298